MYLGLIAQCGVQVLERLPELRVAQTPAEQANYPFIKGK